MTRLVTCAVACAAIAGCASPSTEITVGDSLAFSVHRGESGVSLVEVRIGGPTRCRPAKLDVAWGGKAPIVVARRGREACVPA